MGRGSSGRQESNSSQCTRAQAWPRYIVCIHAQYICFERGVYYIYTVYIYIHICVSIYKYYIYIYICIMVLHIYTRPTLQSGTYPMDQVAKGIEYICAMPCLIIFEIERTSEGCLTHLFHSAFHFQLLLPLYVIPFPTQAFFGGLSMTKYGEHQEDRCHP